MKNLLLFLSLFVLFSCANSPDSTVQILYSEIEETSVSSNANNIYVVSKPLEESEGMPLIIGLDAQGDAELAATSIQKACVDFPAIIAASKIIRNGYPDYQSTITEIIQDCVEKYSIDEKNIILVGFSGGARMAQFFSKEYPVTGVVMIGAGPGAELPDVTTYSMCGTGDFNFIEIYRRPIIEMITEESVCFDHFYGKHEWPRGNELRDAMYFHLKNMNEDMTKRSEVRSQKILDRVDTLVMAGQAMRAWDHLDKAYKLSSDPEKKKRIKANAEDLLENETFRLSVSKLENYLRLELNLRSQFLEATRSEDFEFWKKEIQHYKEKSMYSSNTWEIHHANRVVGYMGVLFYSQLKVLVMTDGYDDQKQTLARAFAYLEPENPDMFYYKAMIHARQENMDSATHYLALARKYGLKE